MPGKILIVDDSDTIRDLVTFTLDVLGEFELTIATDGVDGLAAFETGEYDLILSDIDMPRMDGLAMVRKIRETEKGKSIPIVMLTARETDSDKMKAKEAGADSYLVKPFEPEKLLETINKFLP
jgi:two-component system, chemotaxis family, chemotaxis protein CheY